MAGVLFDRGRLSRALRDRGRFTSEQAEALAEALSEAAHDDLAAKADLAVLKSEIAAVKAELKADIAGLKIELKDEI